MRGAVRKNSTALLNIGVVVTVEEDRRINGAGDPEDPWNRYRSAGVQWVERKAGAGATEATPPKEGGERSPISRDHRIYLLVEDTLPG